MTLRDTARGVAIRAGVLLVGGIVIGGWLTSEAMKAAGAIVKVSAATTALLIAGGVVTWEVKKAQRRLHHRHDAPALAAY